MDHPYASLPASAFWRTAVAGTEPDLPAAIHAPKFALTPDSRIATAGSCFAQHLGQALRRAGLEVLDAEPAPPGIAPGLAQRHGFGLYSGRYGNIYSVRQMVQLLAEVASGRPDPALVWTRRGRHHDALRPGLDPEGLDSAAEVLAIRRRHLARLRPMLARADVFVFTLGLTEAWQCRRSGRVFPSCPGVIAGRFDPDAHAFVNFSYPQVLEDLGRMRAALHGFNPQMRILLTVSPVPLTATAAGGHVLPATQYSKATLRAAAGDFAAAHGDADYFPAYEIVTNPAARGAFFADDLRQVTPEGVAAVMRAFLAAHGIAAGEGAGPAAEASDPVCEDAMLEAFQR
ncbi:GSCFA domain-containing protein [Paracoccus spongiarum]|uniref:GSCFA domain-containing protein n=1 Tax=Paracoccus spongiarum TaxID=3064387 RepID=A0ABT9JBE4_9RHOB|nr:GSCFA domain-containing protein [Paracoccus sp. 2205BS29-5]MDP5307148.1 GSCFA domain-containing protein [Paracoccus sp. 2205BS29-5]